MNQIARAHAIKPTLAVHASALYHMLKAAQLFAQCQTHPFILLENCGYTTMRVVALDGCAMFVGELCCLDGKAEASFALSPGDVKALLSVAKEGTKRDGHNLCVVFAAGTARTFWNPVATAKAPTTITLPLRGAPPEAGFPDYRHALDGLALGPYYEGKPPLVSAAYLEKIGKALDGPLRLETAYDAHGALRFSGKTPAGDNAFVMLMPCRQ